MAKFYADRARLTLNGKKFTDSGNIKSLKVSLNDKLTEVPGMTEDRSTPGFTRGNRSVTIVAQFFIPNDGSSLPNFEALDYEANNYALTCVAGSGAYNGKYAGKTYLLNNIAYDSEDGGFDGVGDAGTITVNFKAQTCQKLN